MVKMAFKNVVEKLKRTLLCCRKEGRKHSLDIGSPTDVRRMDITEGMPDLTEADAKIIREKASNDAIRLLSLQSHPPSQPSSPTADPFASTSAFPSTPVSQTHLPTPVSQTHLPALNSSPSSIRTREPLLNAASSNLPSSLPTPPKQKHAETSPPAFRMKSMWERTRRLSQRSSHRSSAGYCELDGSQSGEDVVMLELDLDLKDDNKSSISIEGFEAQETVGGTPDATPRKSQVVGNRIVQKAIEDMDVGESSDSEVEGRPLVKA